MTAARVVPALDVGTQRKVSLRFGFPVASIDQFAFQSVSARYTNITFAPFHPSGQRATLTYHGKDETSTFVMLTTAFRK